MKPPRHKTPKRRLAIELVESRLMLSGDGVQSLDTDTFNLDQLGVNYAIISNDAESLGVPVLSGTAVKDSVTIRSENESPITRHIAYRDEPLQFNVSDAILRDMAIRTREFSTPHVTFSNANSFGEFRGLLSAGTLDADAVFVIGEPGIGSRFDLMFDRSIEATSVKLLAEGTWSFGLVTNFGLQWPGGETGNSPVSTTDIPALVDRVDDFLPSVGRVDLEIPVNSLRLADDVPWLAIVSNVPAGTIPPVRNSDAQIDIGQIIDELLPSGGKFVDHSASDSLKSASEAIEITENGGASGAEGLFNAPGDAEGTQVVGAAVPVDEGGMISVQGIVGQLAGETIESSLGRDAIVAEAPSELTGELARVAIMELIEGQSDPMAPDSADDHIYLVAADDANFTLERISLGDRDESSAALAAVRIIADQAGLAATFVTPASPIQLAALISAASDALASAAMSAPLTSTPLHEASTDDARSEAFSQWAEAPHHLATDDQPGHSSYGLLLGALAIERVVARRRHKQNAAATPPLPVY